MVLLKEREKKKITIEWKENEKKWNENCIKSKQSDKEVCVHSLFPLCSQQQQQQNPFYIHPCSYVFTLYTSNKKKN